MSKSNAGHTSGPESDQHFEVKVGDSAAPHGAEKDSLWEWTARVRVKKYEVGGSFLVELFLGSVPTDPRQWRTSPNFVGAHYVFTNRCVA
jgi:tyrosinase